MTNKELNSLSEEDRYLVMGIEDGWIDPTNKDLERYYELTGVDIHPIKTLVTKIIDRLRMIKMTKWQDVEQCNSMEFPKDFYEFVDEYGFIDDKEIYTNGSHLIPVFRVEQWLNHIERQSSDDAIKDVLASIETGITATGQSDSYSVGFCNALIWLKSCITHEEPQFFEDVKEVK